MAKDIDELLAKIRSLPHSEQELALRTLLEDLDGPSDPDADRASLDEVQLRSAELDAGIVKTVPGNEVFKRLRSRLK